MRKRYIFDVFLLCLVFMGIAVHFRPYPGDVIYLSSPNEKANIQKHRFSRPFLGNAAKGFADNGSLPDGIVDFIRQAEVSSSYGDYLHSISAVMNPNSSMWNDFQHRRHFSRSGPAEPDETSSTMDYDFASDIRVNNPTTSLQGQPDIAVGDDGTIYACWIDENNSSSYGIYFSKSTDGGATWLPRVAVDTYGPNYRPQMAVYGTGSTARIYIAYVYEYDAANYDYDIYLSYSTDGGSSWNTVVVGGSSYFEDMADVQVDDNGYIYVVYTYAYWSSGSCDEGDVDYYIVYRYSANSGASWSGAITLVSSGCPVGLPSIAMEGGGTSSTMHLTYVYDYNCGSDPTDYDARYRKYANAGSGSPSLIYGDIVIAGSTSDEYIIPDGIDVGTDGNPQIVYIIGDPGDIYYRRSNSGGSSFEAPVAVSTGSADETDPTIALDCWNNPVVCWRDARHGDTDIYFTWSDNGGASFHTSQEVDCEISASDQNWPTVEILNGTCSRDIHFLWWDERYDDGDIYYNGNYQEGVKLHIGFPSGTPPNPPHFVCHRFDQSLDTTISTAGEYVLWFDPEYSNEPRLHQLCDGATGTERWACENPGGWTFMAPSWWWANGVCGEFWVDYYHQLYMTFAPTKGNSSECTHTLPNVDIRYEQFGSTIDTFGNHTVSVSDWVDYGTDYFFRGWIDISPHERWAITSADTQGTAMFSGTISPQYYHQWLPHIWFSGTAADDWTWHTARIYLGYSLVEDSLVTDWQDWADCGNVLAFSETTLAGRHAINDYDTMMIEWIPSYTVIYSSDRFVTVQTDFGGGTVKLDGILYTSPHTELLGPGTMHTIEAPTPQTFDDTVQYHFSQWLDGPTDTVRTITVPDHDITYTAQYDRWFKINLSYTGSTGGHIPSLTGDGWYAEGSWATVTATDGFDSTTGIRYGFSHWESVPPGAYFSDSTSDSTTVLVDNYYTIVAVYSVQYSFTVESDYGSPVPPVGTNWFDAGATVNTIAGSPDTTYHKYCSGFLAGGSGLPASGTADSFEFIITEPSWVRWLWSDQIWLVVYSDWGAPSPPVGLNYYDPGTEIDAFVDSIIYLSADWRQLCVGYTGTDGIGSGGDNNFTFIITSSCTLVWNWQTQYTFEVTNPGGYDSPSPPAGEQWYDEGTSITASVSSPAGGYVCIGYYGTGALPPVSPHDSVTFSLSTPTTIEWRWALFSEVCSLVVISPDGKGAPFPYGTTYWVPGSFVDASVTTPWYDSYPDGVRDSCTGWTGTGSVPSSGDSGAVGFNINVNSTLTWNWQHQYRLDVSNPLGYDTPDPSVGEHWYDAGSVVEGSVTSPWEDSIVCTGYIGTGSLADGDTNWFSFTIDTASSVIWQWEVNNVILTVHSDYGSPSPDTGSHTYLAGTEVLCTVDSVVYISSDERYVCIGWTGSGSTPASGDSNTVRFIIMEDSQIQWLWEHQYRLVVNDGGYGSPVPPDGDNWFAAGDTITCTISPNPVDTFFCVGYSGTGAVPSAYGEDSVTFVLTVPSSITWIWLGAGSVSALIVSSDYGSPYPWVGVHYYPTGTVVGAYMLDATDSLAPGTRRHCVGYSGTGSVGSGADTSVTFTITENSTIDWLWETQHRLTIINPGGYDTPVPSEGEHWFADGTVIYAYISTPAYDTMRCVGYFGTGSVPASGWGTGVTFTLLMPSSIEWRWMGESGICQFDVISSYDTPVPPNGANYIPCGEFVVATVDQVDSTSPGEGWWCTGWTGYGSVPSSGDTNFCVFTLTEHSRIIWNWEARYNLVLNYDGETGGEVPVQTGEGWYVAGETVAVYTDPELFDGSTHYGFMGWVATPSVWIEHPEFFSTRVVVSSPCTLTAMYGVAVSCTLAKSPAENWGGFVVDGISYPETSTVAFWWGRGSHHLVEATTPDISPDSTEAYGFDHWSDAGDTSHWVEASASFVIYAYYLHQYRAKLEKNPAEDLGSIVVDGTTYPGHSYLGYWSDGSYHSISVSTPDTGAGLRYSFVVWSDGDSNAVRDIGPVVAQVDLTAIYIGQAKISVIKNPFENFGTISINDTTFIDAASAQYWVDIGDSGVVDVSRIDIDEITDTAYVFSHWDSDPADSTRPKLLGEITGETNVVANYDKTEYRLSFTLTPTNVWDIDTLSSSETRTMYPFEVIKITNDGTIPVDFGLQTIEDFTSWNAGYLVGYNRYVLRSEFTQNSIPPVTFSYANDYVKSSLTWSTDVIFGPGGYYVTPGDWYNIWLQFIAPTDSYDYTLQRIILRVWARPTIY
ncbi:exo-alpha-sialidase [bacterium]|nr:exo-alpha-sialidase [bacterium]